MTMRRILQCVLVSCVLTMAGCGLLGSSDSTTNSANENTNASNRANLNTSTPTERAGAIINWKSAAENVQTALDKTSSDKSPAFTARQVSDDVNKALKELGDDDTELRNRCDKCDEETLNAAQAAHKSMLKVIGILQPLQRTPLDAQTKGKIKPFLESALEEVGKASKLSASRATAALNTPTPTPTLKSTPDSGETGAYTLTDWVMIGLAIAAGLLVLVLIGTGILHLRNQSRNHFETHLVKAAKAQISATREAQKEVLDKLSSVSSAQDDTSNRLHELHTEIRSLARLVRESSPNRSDGRAYASLASSYAHSDPSPPKAEPDFPVSASDYLGKMTRFANVVRPDFQNGILINDGDGTGELVLIRDPRLPDETQPLFVVPRHAQFQTKQDFLTYYEKYYDCSRPSAGEVWIVEPAIVEKVSGGWQLREKGVLEIR